MIVTLLVFFFCCSVLLFGLLHKLILMGISFGIVIIILVVADKLDAWGPTPNGKLPRKHGDEESFDEH